MKAFQVLLTAKLCVSLLLPQVVHAGFLEFLEPSNIAETVSKQVAKAKIKTDIKLLDADLYDGVNLGLKYKIQSEPSYLNGYYTRLDQYTLGLSVNPWEIIDDMDSPIGFNIRSGTEITFARQFQNQAQSLLALPYTLNHLPINAKRAIEKLQVGDFVGFKANLSLVLSAGTFETYGSLGLSASDYISITGEFLIHAFRLPDNRIRLKLIATRGLGEGVNIKLGVESSLKIVGIKIINDALKKQIDRFINLTPFQLGINHSNTDLFMLDYVFDLNNEAAINAYNNLMSAKLKLKALESAVPGRTKESMEKTLFKDLSEVEAIFEADRYLEPSLRRIDRLFKGSNSSRAVNSNFKFGLNILRFDGGALSSKNNLTYTDRDNVEQKYIFESFNPYFKQSYFFGLYGSEEMISSNLLFKADNRFKPTEFVAMSLTREKKFKSFTEDDYKKIKKHVRSILPESVYSQIDWKNWDFSKGAKPSGYFRNEVFFHTPALAEMNVIPNRSRLTNDFKKYISSRPQPNGQPSQNNDVLFQMSTKNCADWVCKYDQDIQEVGTRLAEVFDARRRVEDRYSSFVSLKNLSLFQERGAGFLISLLPEDRLNEVMHYELTLDAKKAEQVRFTYGNFENEALYRSMLYIQSVIYNRSFDLRLNTDENGEMGPTKH